jgi:hypothetical protein
MARQAPGLYPLVFDRSNQPTAAWDKRQGVFSKPKIEEIDYYQRTPSIIYFSPVCFSIGSTKDPNKIGRVRERRCRHSLPSEPVATSDSPAGPFTKHSGEVFGAKGVMFAAEDPFIWRGIEALLGNSEGQRWQFYEARLLARVVGTGLPRHTLQSIKIISASDNRVKYRHY